jgi:hypothetical protein
MLMPLVVPILIPPQEIARGATLRWMLEVDDDDLTPKDFTGAVIRWRLFDAADQPVIAEKTIGNGVSFEFGNPASGNVVVEASKTETAAFVPGVHRQEWHMTDVLGDVKIWAGRVFVTPTITGVP